MSATNLTAIALCLLFLASGMRMGAAEFDRPVSLGFVTPERLDEISGIAASRRNPGILWVHNDGGKPALSALSTNGQLVGRFRIDADMSDTEDLAAGPGRDFETPALYLGDIGDNNADRENVRVFRFAEPIVADDTDARTNQPVAQFETFVLMYPDGAHDAEALLVDPRTGDLFIATKEKRRSRLYTARRAQLAEGGAVTMALAAEVSFGDVSAGDISPDGGDLILRNEDAARLWRRRDGETIEAALKRPPISVPVVGRPREPNGESIGFDSSGFGYYTVSEGIGAAIYFIRKRF